MANFSISRDMTRLIPYIKAAQAVKGNIRFWASPWTTPTWMKTNSGTANGTSCARVGNTAYDGGCMQDNASYLTGLAQYFVKFVQAVRDARDHDRDGRPPERARLRAGLPVGAVGVGALHEVHRPVPGSGDRRRHLQRRQAEDHARERCPTATAARTPAIVSAVLGDATAKGYVKSVGFQWGMQGKGSSVSSLNVPLWQTEHKCGNYPWNPSGYPAYVASAAPNNQAYAVESWGYIRDWIKTDRVTAYSAWNMVLDTVGKGNDITRDWAQNALLTVNTSSKTLNLTPTYYVFRHIGQFVDAGAKVVATTRRRRDRVQEPERVDRDGHVQLGRREDLDRVGGRQEGLVLDARHRLGDGRPLTVI